MDIGGAREEGELLETFRYLDAQLDRENAALLTASESLGTRATVVAGFAAAAVSLWLLESGSGVLHVVALTLYTASLLPSLAGLWPTKRYGLRPAELLTLSQSRSAVLMGRVAATKAEVFARNYRQGRHRAVLWVLAALLLITATVVAAAQLLLTGST